MSKVIHLQQTLPAPATEVFAALTDNKALQTWFAEHAAVSLEDKRYDFWGRFTPGTPSRNEGRHAIEVVVPNRRLRYTWQLRGAETVVDFRLTPHNGGTIVGLWHHDIPGIRRREPQCYSMDDVWFLWFEALRRYLDGRSVMRCDFSAIRPGSVERSVDIAGSAAEVWDALTNPKQLNRWITSNATAPAAVGGTWTDWGEEGGLKILEIDPQRRMTLAWEIEGIPTVVTWTIEESGGTTRLTLAHSGFASDLRTDGELLGWLQYLSAIQSLVEFGIDWLPPLKEITRDIALYYAAMMWTRQEEILAETNEVWDET